MCTVYIHFLVLPVYLPVFIILLLFVYQDCEVLEAETKRFEDLEFQQLERESRQDEEKETHTQQLLREIADYQRSTVTRKVTATCVWVQLVPKTMYCILLHYFFFCKNLCLLICINSWWTKSYYIFCFGWITVEVVKNYPTHFVFEHWHKCLYHSLAIIARGASQYAYVASFFRSDCWLWRSRQHRSPSRLIERRRASWRRGALSKQWCKG